MKPVSPYSGLPDRQFWRKEPGIVEPALFDPVHNVPFRIGPDDRIVTAGSCFAQHVARYLNNSGYHHLVTEQAHPLMGEPIARTFNYGTFSARYGNLYTARQLRQLLLRAHGAFEPVEKSWPKGGGGRVVDPFRPQIQPHGFVSEAELLVDREQHFRAIREAIRTMDIFVFTLGLTEGWADRRDGAVYPLAPGVAGGVYTPELVAFKNFDLAETVEDMQFSLDYIRQINPNVRIILTVSPVPLNATFEDRHVFQSTTLSKAVLRLAADEMTKRFSHCLYFPSYEVITAPHVRGAYFGPDCREVVEEGVSHVMGLFFKHFTTGGQKTIAPKVQDNPDVAVHLDAMGRAIDMLCDEEAITNE
ncbi:GSCFA domain-containing protein [Sphingobium lactosutens]|uniref:GSCFA domain-containing protein n=1 Tax=Sphingobium lactosutens TaxID=522773 RepID=UPI0015BF4873|nr:GSCFA domain-containing protein [Sphingobium lactosutens]NWK95769.1 GSCFA domain-containing protein [Sphingobium lactosutens]